MRRVPACLAPGVAAILALGVVAAPVGAADPVTLGTVEINGGAIATSDLHVTVTTLAEGATKMRLSNDGLAYKELAWAPSATWDLGDTTYGAQSHPNVPGVFVAFDDGTDTWDEAWTTLDRINYDVTPPTETTMRVSFALGETVSAGGSATHRITWLNSDDVGTQRYEVDERTDGGSWGHVSTTLPLPGLLHALSSGHSHQLRARGVDYAGNVGAWLEGPTVQVTARQESSSKIKWSGTWKRVTAGSFWGGGAMSSTDVGAKAKIRFSGRSIALVARTGPHRGAFTVSIDGVQVDVVNLRGGKLKARQVVWTKWWPNSASHTVSIKLMKVPGGSRAEVDAFIVEG